MRFDIDPWFWVIAVLLLILDLLFYYLKAIDQGTAQSVFVAVVTLVLGWLRGSDVTEKHFRLIMKGGERD